MLQRCRHKQPSRYRLPQRRLGDHSRSGYRRRQQVRSVYRLLRVNRLRHHALKLRCGGSDERQLGLGDFQNVAVCQQRFLDQFAIDVRAVGAAQVPHQPHAVPLQQLRMFSRDLHRFYAQVGRLGTPDAKWHLFECHAAGFPAAVGIKLQARLGASFFSKE